MARRATRTAGGRGTEQSRVLSAILEFGLDERQHETFKQQMAGIEQQLVEVDEHVKHLNQSLEMGGAGGLEEGSFGYAWLNKQFMDAEDHAASLETQLREGLNVAITQVQENLEESVARTRDLASQVEEFGGAMAQRGAGMLGLAFPGQFVPLRALESMFNINAMMTRYLDKVGLASEEGRRWALAQERVEESQLRIGQVASEALIPFMERVADLAETGAQFVEEHPDLIRGFVTVGGILISAGTLATVLSKGISLVADAKTLFAAKLQDQAGTKMVQAATMQSTAAGGIVAGGGTMMKAATLMGQVAIGLVAGEALSREFTGQGLAGWFTTEEGVRRGQARVGGMAAAGPSVEEQEAELAEVQRQLGVVRDFYSSWFPGLRKDFGDLVEVMGPKLAHSGTAMADMIAELETMEGALVDSIEGTRSLADTFQDLGEEAGLTSILLQANVDAYIKYRHDVAQTDQKFQDDRLAIWLQAGEELLVQEESYQERRQATIQQLQDQWAAEDETAVWNEYIAGLRAQRKARLALEQHLEELAGAEEDYQEKRREAIENHQETLRENEENHLEALEDMRENYEFTQEDAIRARDAIAYVRNLRNYQKQVADEEERYREQVADTEEQHRDQLDESEDQHREMMQQKQEQRDEQLEAEREQAEFERRIQDMELKHRRMMQQKTMDEQLAAMLEEHREEMSEIRRQRTLKLTELREGHTEERNVLKQQLADVLFDELQLKADFYAQMEEEAIAWMERYQSILHPSQYVIPEPGAARYPVPGTGGTRYQHGGYAREGIGQMHAGEFVLSPETTSMAERLAGGHLTQQTVLQSMRQSLVIHQSGWHISAGSPADTARVVKKAAYDAALDAYTVIMREY